MIRALTDYLDKYKAIFKSKSHAVMLISDDSVLRQNLAEIYCMTLHCTGIEKPCFMCAECLKCLDKASLDILEVGKNGLKTEDVEGIIEYINILPSDCDTKIVVIHDVDKASLAALNKLLKSLEEPPEYIKYILTCENVKKIPLTILSRVEKFNLQKLTDDEIRQIYSSENDIDFAIKNCNNSLEKAEKILKNPQYKEFFNFCYDMLKNMKKSSQMVEYSFFLTKNKTDIDTILEILESILRDILLLYYDKSELIKNNDKIEEIKILQIDFKEIAVLKILEHINYARQKLLGNANINGVIDTLLLKILEEKFYAKNSRS